MFDLNVEQADDTDGNVIDPNNWKPGSIKQETQMVKSRNSIDIFTPGEHSG